MISLQSVDSLTRETSVAIAGAAQDDGLVRLLTIQLRRPKEPWLDRVADTLPVLPAPGITFSKTYPISEGENAFDVAAYDTAGNKSLTTVTVRSDRTPAELYVIAPWSVTTSTATISINGRAYPEKVLSVSYSVNGGAPVFAGVVTGTLERYPLFPRRNQFAPAISVPVTSDSAMVTVLLTDPAGNVASKQVVVRRLGAFSSVVGNAHWCMLTATGNAWCWGDNARGQLGTGDTRPSSTPVPVGGGLTFKQLSVGDFRTCGATTAGEAYCWGDDNGRSVLLPTAVPGGLRFTSVSTSLMHTCGISTDRVAYCWGLNPEGMLGDGTRTDHASPQPVDSPVLFDSIATGHYHSCALAPTDGVYCWGWNLYGQIGTGGRQPLNFLSPVRAATEYRFASILASFEHSCGIAKDGYGYCWGRADDVQLGTGAGIGGWPSPNRVLTPEPIQSLSITVAHGCGIGVSGTTYCWGNHHRERLGRLFIEIEYGFDIYPETSAYGTVLQSVHTGRWGTCGLTANGALYCWGKGDDYGLTPVIGP